MAWFDGALAPGEAADVEAHLGGCASCRAELEWLRAEAELMARRREAQPPLKPEVWRRVAERIHAPQKKPWWSLSPMVAMFGGLAVTAGLILLVGRGDVPRPSVTSPAAVAAMPSPHRRNRDPRATLDRAEREYRDALAVLESEYRQHRGRLTPGTAARYDRSIQRNRRAVDSASQAAHQDNDVDGRLALFDGYEEYMRSLQVVVAELPHQVNQ